jgi:LuxR family glucitol operon transcriptional activator
MMSFSATRLTLYALISSIESDLRYVIRIGLRDQLSLENLLGEDLLKRTISRLEKIEGKNENEDYTLEGLLYYVDLGDLYQIINRFSDHGG